MYTYKNKYFKRSRISEKKMREIIKYFALDLTVTQISELVNLHRSMVSRLIQQVRIKIGGYCENISEFEGEIECDESYFGGKKKGDKRGRGVSNKIPVFGILKRDGKVYAQIIKNAFE